MQNRFSMILFCQSNFTSCPVFPPSSPLCPSPRSSWLLSGFCSKYWLTIDPPPPCVSGVETSSGQRHNWGDGGSSSFFFFLDADIWRRLDSVLGSCRRQQQLIALKSHIWGVNCNLHIQYNCVQKLQKMKRKTGWKISSDENSDGGFSKVQKSALCFISQCVLCPPPSFLVSLWNVSELFSGWYTEDNIIKFWKPSANGPCQRKAVLLAP